MAGGNRTTATYSGVDLFTATRRASLNPFSLLVAIDDEASDREHMLLPMHAPDHAASSSLIHELTHLWCFRGTGLGLTSAWLGAECLQRWRLGLPVVPAQVERWRAFVEGLRPLLEGLAIFAQLDYLPTAPAPLLDAPMLSFCDLHAARMSGASRHALLWMFREHAILPPTGYAGTRDAAAPPGLLELLFLDSTRGDLGLYLAGYLFVKALQASVRRKCPPLAASELFLPLAVKLICDCPAIPRLAAADVLSPLELFRAVHQELRALPAERLPALHTRLQAEPALRTEFPNIDLHPFLAGREGLGPAAHGPSLIARAFVHSPHFGDALGTLSSGAYVHVASWRTGELRGVEDDGHPRLILRSSAGQDENLVAPFVLDDLDDGRVPHVASTVLAAAARVNAVVRAAVGRRLTVASFYVVFGATVGTAYWIDDVLVGWIPFDARSALNLQEAQLVSQALQASPVARAAFARAMSAVGSSDALAAEVSDAVADTLVGDPASADRLLSQRFRWLELGRHIPAIRRWCYPDYDEAAPWSEAALQAAQQVVTCPGWSPGEQPPPFVELLPEMTRLPTPFHEEAP